MTHTTVYLDFDGVINAINHMPPTAKTEWRGEWTRTRIDGYSIMWSHELIEFFRDLGARDDVTIKWLTTWTTDAPKLLAPELGIGADWPVVGAETPESRFEDFANWWKLEALQNDIAESPPGKVVWVDDDFTYERKALMTLSNYSFDTVAITTSPEIGLTRDQTEGILRFVNYR